MRGDTGSRLARPASAIEGMSTMTKWTLGTVGFLALSACAQQEPPAAPAQPVEPASVAPAPVAVTTTPAPAPALPPLTAEERVKWFQGCWAAFNAKDWAKFAPTCYADGAMSEQVDSGFPIAMGRADIEKTTKGFAAQHPDANGEQQLTLVSSNAIASIVLLRGTNSGPLLTPGGGTAPATNKKFGVLMAQVVESSEDGRSAQRDRFFLDSSSLLGQLGLNPTPHRKLIEKSWAEKPVVIATGSEVEKANLAAMPKGIEAPG